MFERPGVLSVGDQVVFDGTVHTVVAISGTKIRLLSEAGRASVVALPFLLSAEDFELVGLGPAAPMIERRALLDALPDEVLAAAKDWERHVVEVETGVPPDAPAGIGPRPGYDPVTQSMAAREKVKAAELSAAGRQTSARTVQRMRRRYREQGLWGLVDSRYVRMLGPTGQVDPRVVAAATVVVAAQTGTSTGTKSRAIAQIQRLLDDEHGPGVVPMPSPATCYRLLDTLAKGRHTFRVGCYPAAGGEQAGPRLHPDDGGPAGGAGAFGRHPAGCDGGHGRRGDRPRRAGAGGRYRHPDYLFGGVASGWRESR